MEKEEIVDLVKSLPETNYQIELLDEVDKPVLEDVIDFIEIRFPHWKQELGSWSAEFLLSAVDVFEDFYENEYTKEEYIDFLSNLYRNIEDKYTSSIRMYAEVLEKFNRNKAKKD